MNTKIERPTGAPDLIYSKKKLSLLELVLMGAILAGALQSLLITALPALSFASSLDDILVVLALVVVLPRIRRVSGLYFLLIALYLSLMIFGAFRSTTTVEISIQLLRQVALPALLILIGLTLQRWEWDRIIRIALVISVANSLYMIFELSGIRLIDPNVLAASYGNTVVQYEGLPGYYFYYDSALAMSVRAGGLFLNPPVAGLVVAVGAITAWHTLRGKMRYILVALQLIAVYSSFGRGGFVVAAVGILLPVLINRFGRIFAFLLPIYPAYLIYSEIAASGSSASHSEGLFYGITTAIMRPFGDGFGSVGNFVKLVTRDTEASESLAGVALVAGGLAVLVILVLLLIALVRRVFQNPLLWPAALGIGGLITALFSESTGALNGTIPLWLAIGVALGPASKSFLKLREGRKALGRP